MNPGGVRRDRGETRTIGRRSGPARLTPDADNLDPERSFAKVLCRDIKGMGFYFFKIVVRSLNARNCTG